LISSTQTPLVHRTALGGREPGPGGEGATRRSGSPGISAPSPRSRSILNKIASPMLQNASGGGDALNFCFCFLFFFTFFFKIEI
jgi:hypothetical protein